MTREDIAEVPGAALRYRLTGTPTKLPLIVLENGWGASYDYFALMQDALAPHAQVLLYNRAGIGGSIAREPQSAEGISRQLAALLDALGLREKVVVAGQSYGGLMCGLHAVQIPERLRAVVQIDATSERDDPQIDATLKMIRGVAAFLIGLALLRIPEPMFVREMKELAPADSEKLRRYAFGNAASLRAARVEIDLLPQIRAVCARPSASLRLVISADRTEQVRGLILSKLVSPERGRALLACMQAQHEENAKRGGEGSRWIKLPHTHGGLVVTRAGATETTTCLVEYLKNLK